MFSELQKHSIQAIVNIFETGKPQGEYGQVTLLPGDSGHLTYGRSQTTLASGNLFLLISAYCKEPDAQFGVALTKYLNRLENADIALDHDKGLRLLLRQAGDDPVMMAVQDAFFDRVYWEPALRSARSIGSETALGMAVVYDSRIHGSWKRMRDRTDGAHGTLSDLGEQTWMARYLDTRRHWLANHSNKLLGKTVYRMDALMKLMKEDNWSLSVPFSVRGMAIDEAVLSGAPLRASAAIAEERLLRLRTPFMQGQDVHELQDLLAAAGVDIEADGVFGPATKAAVVAFQEETGLPADGIVGTLTRTHLGIDI